MGFNLNQVGGTNVKAMQNILDSRNIISKARTPNEAKEIIIAKTAQSIPQAIASNIINKIGSKLNISG